MGRKRQQNRCTHSGCLCDRCHRKAVKHAGKNPPIPACHPSITINVFTECKPSTPPNPHIKLGTSQYSTVAKVGKRIYTNLDALIEYGSSDILNPQDVSYINLFVNGVLQPESLYEVEEGMLYLKSGDLPPADAPIILLFVMVKGQ